MSQEGKEWNYNVDTVLSISLVKKNTIMYTYKHKQYMQYLQKA